MLDVLLPARSITSKLFKLCHRPDAFSELESTTGLADEASPRGYRERKGDSFEEKVNDVGDYHGDLGLESGRGSDVKLRDLRKLMKEESVDIYLVPMFDAHNSEYISSPDKRITFLSNFHGSAGTVLVLPDSAHLFTDGRYHVQASKEIDGEVWELHKVGVEGVKDWDAWLEDRVGEGDVVGFDGRLLDYGRAKSLSDKLKAKGARLEAIERNLVDEVWGPERPARTLTEIYIQGVEFSGLHSTEKLSKLRSFISSRPATSSNFVISGLSSVAWILNLRASDIPYNPFFLSYLVVGKDEGQAWLFVDGDAEGRRLNEEVAKYLRSIGVEVRGYDEVWEFLKGVEWEKNGKCLASSSVSYALVQAIGEGNVDIVRPDPIDTWRSIKNEVEVEGFRKAYLRAAVGWARWMAWLEEEVVKKKSQVTEWEAGVKLNAYWKEQPYYRGDLDRKLAYTSISATNENAALPHYSPKPGSSRVIDTFTPYLMDAGPQFQDGTTDTTRTYHFGRPTPEQKRAFTRVLQGHIALDTAVFPNGTTGFHLDSWARRALWSDGMDYMHGTGHGFGSFLGVHEGPQGIGSSLVFTQTPLQPGHVLTNEPGYYEAGSFGIRTESALVVKRVKTKREFGEKEWYGFERS